MIHRKLSFPDLPLFASALLLAAALPAASGADLVAPGARLQKLAEGFSFTEGPSTDAEGNVFFTDQPNDRIVKWSTDGTISDWLKPAGRSNGTKFDKHGNLVTCADEKNELWSIAPDKKVTVLVKEFGGHPLNGPNDVWIRPDGNLYFTDPLYPRDYWKPLGRSDQSEQPGHYVFYLNRKTGSLKPVCTDLIQPNGIVGLPDGKTLYVADIDAHKTYSYQIQPNGGLTDKKLFCNLGSDGMALDAEGNVYLTGNGVTIFDPSGKQIEHIEVREPWTANITFAGQDRKLLFLTASHCIYGIRMRVRGAY